MYKVFINDNEVQFLAENATLPPYTIELSKKLNPLNLLEEVVATGNGHHLFAVKKDAPQEMFEKFTNAFPVIEAAGGIVRHQHPEGPILMIFRRGKWDLPKGKIDNGESNKQAALREVEEECGIGGLTISGNAGTMHHFYQLKGKWVIKKTWWYRMICNDDSELRPETAEDITEVRWVSEKEVQKLLPGAYASIADLLKNEISGN